MSVVPPGGESSPSRRLLGRGSVYTVASAVQLGVAAAVLPLVTRVLPVDEFGLVATAVVLIQLLTVCAALGLPAAVTRFYFDEGVGEAGARRLVRTVMLTAVLTAVLLGSLEPLWGETLQLSPVVRSVMVFVVAAIVPGAIAEACLAFFRVHDQPGRFVTVAMCQSLVAQALGLACAYLLRPDAISFLTGLLAGRALAAVLGIAWMGLHGGLASPSEVLAAMRFGVPTIAHVASMHVLAAGDRIMVEHFLGFSSVARYHVAYIVGSVGTVLLSAFNHAWSPIILGAKEDERWQQLAVTGLLVHRLAAGGVAIIALLSPIALTIAAPSGYEIAALVAPTAVVAFSAVMMSAYLAGVHVIFQTKRTGVLAWVSPTAACVNLALNLVLLPRMGLIGAAFATVMAYGVQAGLVRIVARGTVAVPWRRGAMLGASGVALVGAGFGAVLTIDGLGLAFRVGGALAALLAMMVVARGRGTIR